MGRPTMAPPEVVGPRRSLSGPRTNFIAAVLQAAFSGTAFATSWAALKGAAPALGLQPGERWQLYAVLDLLRIVAGQPLRQAYLQVLGPPANLTAFSSPGEVLAFFV